MAEELSPSEVARRLGTSTRTVQRWIEQGRLPARRVGGRWRVAFDAFDASDTPGVPTPRPIRRLFIANRGEIARRIGRTADRLGITAITPATDGPGALDLLDIDAVLATILATDADAVHPGFGFLAENPTFAERVIAAGVTWVGPPPDAIRLMGDKAAARRLATSLGIPVPAGYDDADQSDDVLVAAAQRIGLPLLVKPAAGGGGKGIHTVRTAANLAASLSAARREALAAFGDDRLILERLIEGGRHVEIQVLFDGHGHGIHLGERDCSLQRRHQKVLEESPSPALDPARRERLGAAALSLAGAVGYVGAGTCEFLLDDRGDATFLEMNTRLQVEHPVTEAVTGRDLVADQLHIASGGRLDIDQGEVRFDGHAIEVRLYAEDAEAGFLPATGRVERLRWPSGDGIRVDAGIDEGDEVSSRYDPMLAKIVAHGPDRATALARLTDALDRTVVLGLVTNLRFLRWGLREPAVREALVRTDTLDRLWPPDDWPGPDTIPTEAWSAAAALLADAPERGDPWGGGWRLNASPSVALAAGDVRAQAQPGGGAPGDPAAIDAVRVGSTAHVDVAGRSVAITLAPPPDVDRAASAAASAGGAGPVDLMAPMPGQVIAIHANAGDVVASGDPVITLEAMKMEHAVTSPIDGLVDGVLVALGDQVTRGQTLATVTVVASEAAPGGHG